MEKKFNLRLFRKANGLTQLDVAEYLGVSKGFISQVETGKSSLPEDKLQKLLDVPDPTISLGMGHRIAGHRTTAIYIKRDQRKVDEANRKVIDYIKGTVPHLTT